MTGGASATGGLLGAGSAAARTVTVIRPDARRGTSAFAAVRALAHEVREHRAHIWINFSSDFTAGTRETGLGLVWNLALPAVSVAAFIALSLLRVLPTREGIPGIAYIAVGVTVWTLLADLVRDPIVIVQNRSAAISRTSFPLIGVVMSGFAQSCFDTLVRLVVATLIVAWSIGLPPVQALLAPLLLIPGIVLCLGTGLFLSIVNVASRDVEKVVRVFLQYAIFFSCAIFPMPETGIVGAISRLNPFASIINNTRSMLVLGHMDDWTGYLVTCALAVPVFLLGCRLFYVMEPRVRSLG